MCRHVLAPKDVGKKAKGMYSTERVYMYIYKIYYTTTLLHSILYIYMCVCVCVCVCIYIYMMCYNTVLKQNLRSMLNLALALGTR